MLHLQLFEFLFHTIYNTKLNFKNNLDFIPTLLLVITYYTFIPITRPAAISKWKLGITFNSLFLSFLKIIFLKNVFQYINFNIKFQYFFNFFNL